MVALSSLKRRELFPGPNRRDSYNHDLEKIRRLVFWTAMREFQVYRRELEEKLTEREQEHEKTKIAFSEWLYVSGWKKLFRSLGMRAMQKRVTRLYGDIDDLREKIKQCVQAEINFQEGAYGMARLVLDQIADGLSIKEQRSTRFTEQQIASNSDLTEIDIIFDSRIPLKERRTQEKVLSLIRWIVVLQELEQQKSLVTNIFLINRSLHPSRVA